MNIKLKIFIFLLLISPIFWWQFINHNNPLDQYSKTFIYVKNKTSSIFTNTKYIDEFRWNDNLQNRSIVGRVFYNKSRFVFDQVFYYLNILSPRFYFQSGTGQPDSPPQVELIPFLLFPISFLGIFKIIKKQKYKTLFLFLVSCFPSYITGQSNIYFSFPIALFYLYFSSYELSYWHKKPLLIFLVILSIYSLFIFSKIIYSLSL